MAAINTTFVLSIETLSFTGKNKGVSLVLRNVEGRYLGYIAWDFNKDRPFTRCYRGGSNEFPCDGDILAGLKKTLPLLKERKLTVKKGGDPLPVKVSWTVTSTRRDEFMSTKFQKEVQEKGLDLTSSNNEEDVPF